MAPTLEKDPSILTLLDRLRDDLGSASFDVVDHWDADLCAIGLGLPANHQVLVYVSTFGSESGRYDYELESPPTSEGEVYSAAGRGEGCTYEELLGIIKSHMKV
jgi:hypothetical protein